jgi:hypothetical protein
VKQHPKQEQEWLQEQEWIGKLSLIYGALILIGVYMVQPFLTATSLDLSAKISVVAFSVAIPLLAALVMLNWQEVFRRRLTRSVIVEVARVVAQMGAFVGVVAGFWHMWWIAGVGVLASGVVGFAVHSAGYVRLERDREAPPRRRIAQRYRVLALQGRRALQAVRDGGDHDGRLEQEGSLERQGGLIVEEPVPPLPDHELREDDSDERLGLLVEDPADPGVDRPGDLPVGRIEDLERHPDVEALPLVAHPRGLLVVHR